MTETDQIQITRKTHFTILCDVVIDDERIERDDLLVYLALCRFADKAGECFPSYSTIAKKARISRRQAIDVVRRLIEFGYLKKNSRGTTKNHQSNIYTIMDEARSDTPGVVHPVHQVVHTVHQGSAPDTPEVDTLEVDTLKGSNITAPALFKQIREVALIFADRPPLLSKKEKELAVSLSKKYTAGAVLNAWEEYQRTKPGKPFRFFVEDTNDLRMYTPVRNTVDQEYRKAKENESVIRTNQDPHAFDEVKEALNKRSKKTDRDRIPEPTELAAG